MPVLASEFVSAMACVPGPVAVATMISLGGRRWGFTASSFSSLSVDPPLVLICLDKTASTHEAFTSTDRFMVNVLASGQEGVARRFATSAIDRFAADDMQPCELGLPGLPGASARIACTLHEVLDGGDHSILVGLVEASYVGEPAPLVYWDRGFSYPTAVA
jgi:flavin reductase ActVB